MDLIVYILNRIIYMKAQGTFLYLARYDICLQQNGSVIGFRGGL